MFSSHVFVQISIKKEVILFSFSSFCIYVICVHKGFHIKIYNIYIYMHIYFIYLWIFTYIYIPLGEINTFLKLLYKMGNVFKLFLMPYRLIRLGVCLWTCINYLVYQLTTECHQAKCIQLPMLDSNIGQGVYLKEMRFVKQLREKWKKQKQRGDEEKE